MAKKKQQVEQLSFGESSDTECRACIAQLAECKATGYGTLQCNHCQSKAEREAMRDG
jgi:hypothetical protein